MLYHSLVIDEIQNLKVLRHETVFRVAGGDGNQIAFGNKIEKNSKKKVNKKNKKK